MTKADIQHMAFVLVHRGLGEDAIGGCSCETCCEIRVAMDELAREEVKQFMAENYPPKSLLVKVPTGETQCASHVNAVG